MRNLAPQFQTPLFQPDVQRSQIGEVRRRLAEYGIVLPQGPWRFATQAPSAVEHAALSDLGRELFTELLDQLTDVNDRVARLDAKIGEICREREDCRRLSELPGVGPIIATALVASVEDGRHFKSGRELAAWIGLVPRQATSRRNWPPSEPLSSSPDDPWCACSHQPTCQARRSPISMAERARRALGI